MRAAWCTGTRALAIGDSLQSLPRRWLPGSNSYWHAAILAALGQRDEAMLLLRNASHEGVSMASWHYDEPLASLRDYPPFEAMIKPQK